MIQYTGLEGYSHAELQREFFARYEPLVHSPIELEMAQRLGDLIDAEEQTAAIDDLLAKHDVTVADLNALAEAIIDCPVTTLGLLNVLAEHDIDDIDQLANIISKGKNDVT